MLCRAHTPRSFVWQMLSLSSKGLTSLTFSKRFLSEFIQFSDRVSTYLPHSLNTALQLCATHEYTVQCGGAVENHTLRRSTPYHYKPYLAYPAQHLNFARCTTYTCSYMPSRHLWQLNKPLVSPGFC